MEILLKNIKHCPSLSEETEAFTADLYIDGKKVAHCSNSGHGGETNISGYTPEDCATVRKAQEFFASQPEIYSEEFDFKYKDSLENHVDTFLNGWIWEKEMAKHMKKNILFGDPKNPNAIGWKMTIADLLKSPRGIEAIKKVIADIKARGEKILNTNLPESLLA